jgi:homocitrate synthase NifV
VKDKDIFVSISAEDVGRTELSFLQEYAGVVSEAGADRLRLSDTIGILDFYQYQKIIQKIRDACSIDLQCHTHNDFGLAVANTLAGILAGARYFHVTVNGIGERAGMPDILQVVVILKKIYGIDLGLNLKKIVKVSGYLQKITNTIGYPWTPIIGQNVFSHESGIHVHGMINDRETFEAIDPKELGKTTKFVLGKHSGRTTIEYYLAREKIHFTKEDLSMCLKLVRERSIQNLGDVSVGELIELHSQAKEIINTQK